MISPIDAVALGYPPDRGLVVHVALIAEAIAGVGRHHGQRAVRVGLVEELKGLVDRVGSHVRDVHQDPVAGHRPHGGDAKVGEALALALGEQAAVEAVREERKRRRHSGHAAEEQVRDGDVGDPAPCELRDVGVDLCCVPAQMEAALDAVHETRGPVGHAGVELGAVVDDPQHRAVVRADLGLHASRSPRSSEK